MVQYKVGTACYNDPANVKETVTLAYSPTTRMHTYSLQRLFVKQIFLAYRSSFGFYNSLHSATDCKPYLWDLLFSQNCEIVLINTRKKRSCVAGNSYRITYTRSPSPPLFTSSSYAIVPPSYWTDALTTPKYVPKIITGNSSNFHRYKLYAYKWPNRSSNALTSQIAILYIAPENPINCQPCIQHIHRYWFHTHKCPTHVLML